MHACNTQWGQVILPQKFFLFRSKAVLFVSTPWTIHKYTMAPEAEHEIKDKEQIHANLKLQKEVSNLKAALEEQKTKCEDYKLEFKMVLEKSLMLEQRYEECQLLMESMKVELHEKIQTKEKENFETNQTKEKEYEKKLLELHQVLEEKLNLVKEREAALLEQEIEYDNKLKNGASDNIKPSSKREQNDMDTGFRCIRAR